MNTPLSTALLRTTLLVATTLGMVASPAGHALADGPDPLGQSALNGVVDSYRVPAEEAQAKLLSGQFVGPNQLAFDREIVIGSDGGFHYRVPNAPSVALALAVGPVTAERAPDDAATRVPELDPSSGHAALTLLLGAVAVLRRRRG